MWRLRHWPRRSADRQEELKAGKVGEKLTYLKAASPVVTLAPRDEAEMKAQTVGKPLSDVVPQALVETEAVAVAEKVSKTIKDTLTFRL